jgi:hypothetical protein
MPWFKVDDGFAVHPKAVAAGNAALGLWVRAGSWSAQQLTDGQIPAAMLPVLGGNTKAAQCLVRAGLWAMDGADFRFHDWEDYQPDAADIRAERATRYEAKARAGRLGGIRSGEARRQQRPSRAEAEPEAPDEADGKQNEAPVLTRPVPGTTTDVVVPRADVDRLCAHLADRVEANGSKRPNVTDRWRDAARLLIDRDGHTEDQVRRAIDWCQDDEFWRANVLSMPTLREKYDQLRLAAGRSHTSANGHRRQADLSGARQRALAAEGRR